MRCLEDPNFIVGETEAGDDEPRLAIAKLAVAEGAAVTERPPQRFVRILAAQPMEAVAPAKRIAKNPWAGFDIEANQFSGSMRKPSPSAMMPPVVPVIRSK